MNKEEKLTPQPESCNITAKGSSCCSSAPEPSTTDLKAHWNNAYCKSAEENLGWFETDLEPTLRLVKKSDISSDARILNIGAGSTTLVDELLALGYTQLLATDISEVALQNLQKRVGAAKIEIIIDDLTNPTLLSNIAPIDLWIDRAVIHFFTKVEDQNTYFNLLKQTVKKGGYVLLAEYNLEGATKCAGLDVHRYDAQLLATKIGNGFELVDNFDFTYTMPSGALRPYIYTLFKRIK